MLYVPFIVVWFQTIGKNCSENEKIIVIRIYYFNPAFSEMFGWTLDELAGRHIPYVPPDLVEETGKGIKKPTPGKFIRRFETRRLTKDGRVLDAAVRVATFSEGAADDDAQLAILIDLTREKRAARNNEILLRSVRPCQKIFAVCAAGQTPPTHQPCSPLP